MKTQIPKSKPKQKQVYDHRLRELVYQTGDINTALNLGVPRSTASSWLTNPLRKVISHEFFDQGDFNRLPACGTLMSQ